jgi:hypothetical protein
MNVLNNNFIPVNGIVPSSISTLEGALGQIEKEITELEDLARKKERLKGQIVDLDAKQFLFQEKLCSMREIKNEYTRWKNSTASNLDGELEERFSQLLTSFVGICKQNQTLCDEIEGIEQVLQEQTALQGTIASYKLVLRANFESLTDEEKKRVETQTKNLNAKLFSRGIQILNPISTIQRAYRSFQFRQAAKRCSFARSEPNSEILFKSLKDREAAIRFAIMRNEIEKAVQLIRQGAISDRVAEDLVDESLKLGNSEIINALIQVGFNPNQAAQNAIKWNIDLLPFLNLQGIDPEIRQEAIRKSIESNKFQLAQPLVQSAEDAWVALRESYIIYLLKKEGSVLNFISYLVSQEYAKNQFFLSGWDYLIKTAVERKEYDVVLAFCQTVEQKNEAILYAARQRDVLLATLLCNNGDVGREEEDLAFRIALEEGQFSSLLQMIHSSRNPDALNDAVHLAARLSKIPDIIRLLNRGEINPIARQYSILEFIWQENYLGLIALMQTPEDWLFTLSKTIETEKLPLTKRLLAEGKLPEGGKQMLIAQCIEYLEEEEAITFLEALIQTVEEREFAILCADRQERDSLIFALLEQGDISAAFRYDRIKVAVADKNKDLLEALIQSPHQRGVAVVEAASQNRAKLVMALLRKGEITSESCLRAAQYGIQFENYKVVRAITKDPNFPGFDFPLVKTALIMLVWFDAFLKLAPLSEKVRHQTIQYCVSKDLPFVHQLIKTPDDRGVALVAAASKRRRKDLFEKLKKGGPVPHHYLLQCEQIYNK